jgi:hypothetical protein
VAFLGGAALFLVSLILTRLVTVRGQHGLGVALKLVTAGLILCLLAAESVVPPLAIAAALAVILSAFVFVEATVWRTA